MDPKSHWERVYRTKLPTQVRWYQPHALRSLDLIRRVSPPPNGAIIDVGGGASTLTDDLLDAGYQDLTVLDLSGSALAQPRARLGARAGCVRWVEADVLNAPLPRPPIPFGMTGPCSTSSPNRPIARRTSRRCAEPFGLAGSS